MPRLTGFLRRFSRPLKIAIQLGILAVILLVVVTVGFIEYSAQPSFCTNCHIMQPYYDSWSTSSHNNVKCISCHYAPGIKAEAMGKLQAANQVVKYVTGAYGMKPWAEIEDAACLRSGCHTERALEGQLNSPLHQLPLPDRSGKSAQFPGRRDRRCSPQGHGGHLLPLSF
jgi:trimethylamine-N-oxide reductase cytochrome c-type subunit TorC